MKDLLDSITDSKAIKFVLFFLLAVVCISVYYQLGENIGEAAYYIINS